MSTDIKVTLVFKNNVFGHLYWKILLEKPLSYVYKLITRKLHKSSLKLVCKKIH
jgi:hypothetical protein